MSKDLVPYNAGEIHSVIVHTIESIIKIATGIGIPITVINNSFGGFILYLENEAALFAGRQINIKQTRENFNTIINSLELIKDPTSSNACNFCKRVHHLANSDRKFKFMSVIISAYQSNQAKAIEKFSQMEEHLVDRFLKEFQMDL
ncbi:MAG: hypothetical protein GY795_47900 [Desulfobacterales bacterium]|nr:hypothetical protein [Desulfobacterales bacterium]